MTANLKLQGLAALCLCEFYFASRIASAAPQPPHLRLPDAIAPVSYRVELTLDPAKPDFAGSITIRLNVKKSVDTVWLNATRITVSGASLQIGDRLLAAKPVPGGDNFLGFQFDSLLPTGPAELRVSYRGLIRKDNFSGIFSQTDNGNRYLYTQFENTDARAAFPCFDEPSYKVPWQLTLNVPQSFSAVSNTPYTREQTQGDSKVYIFAETKPLPSYLVAFAVGPFEFVDAGFAGSKMVPVRIVVPKGHCDEAKYAREVTATIVNRLEAYFGMPYPYEKVDQLAVPVSPTAMENAGLITYPQASILAKPDRDTEERQRSFALLAGHELAHQWFGNLVTPAWWDDIWLNEAFATWMEQKLLAEWKPEWKSRVSDVARVLRAKSRDGLLSSRKIRQEIKSADDIINAFDGITYDKGASVIGMFENWIDPEQFRQGVQVYLKQYAFRNATASDFLDSVASFGDKRLAGAFSTFLNQSGVPLVSVSLDCRPTPVLHLEQKRYSLVGAKRGADQIWQIPFCFRYGVGMVGERTCTLLTQAQSEVRLKGSSCPKWVEANDGAIGYYHVNYSSKLLRSLVDGDVTNRLAAPERVDILGTAKALVDGGMLPAADALQLIETLHDDTEREVTARCIDLALWPSVELVPASSESSYQNFVRQNFGARAHKLGWVPKSGESDDAKLLRPNLMVLVATVGGDQELAQEAGNLIEKWLTNQKAITPDMLAATLRTAAYYGDKTTFDRFLSVYRKSTDRHDRAAILDGMNDSLLPSFRDPSAIRAAKEATLSGAVPFIEGASLLVSGQRPRATRRIAFDFLQDHYNEILSNHAGGSSDWRAHFPYVGYNFCDVQSEEELRRFFEPRVSQLPGAPRSLARVLERIEACVASKRINQPSVEAFLKRY